MNHQTDGYTHLYHTLAACMTEKDFLRRIKLTAPDMAALLQTADTNRLAEALLAGTDERGRFSAKKVLALLQPQLDRFCEPPAEGWLQHAYNHVLGRLFPEKASGIPETPEQAAARLFLLQFLKGLYRFERETLPFDPTLDFAVLTQEERRIYTGSGEYSMLLHMADKHFVYEFMRLGIELTPFNTLGHIAGVHYVAMHAARQLAALHVPLDLGLVSGAAAGHDIGKYGCKKSEEKRIPYLHYYYTDLCFNRFDMPMIGHIAANHSTWDLELDNLSAESLLLIYADFRVKSSRDAAGQEVVHFYSLAESFDVILNKLDNVDAAKEHRYHKVYNKLRDFESYMQSLGVLTDLPQLPRKLPPKPLTMPAKDYALLSGDAVVKEFKNLSIAHNIRLMNKFYNQEDFANLIETARSEKNWKNLRTYISILGEYSTYMTEKQKLMTHRFLLELLVHKESDIRNQAAEVIGQIIAQFNEEYKKELPAGVAPPHKDITNLSLWADTLRAVLIPDHKLTDQHKKWLENSLKSIAYALLSSVSPDRRTAYADQLLDWYRSDSLTYRNKESLLQTAVMLEPHFFTPEQIAHLRAFADRMITGDDLGLKAAAIDMKHHYLGARFGAAYDRDIKACLGFDPETALTREDLSEMYLDNLKASTPWPVKIANIQLMLRALAHSGGDGQALHVATHLGNLVKVSETVVVRKSAGRALVSMIDRLPLEQRNEIAVELSKGLEIGDYQFSKYIPDYLGVLMLHLPPRELDELLLDLAKFFSSTNSQVVGAVLHTLGVVLEHYDRYQSLFGTQESAAARDRRKYKILSLIVRGFANYDDAISQEALWSIGMNLFGSAKLSLAEKYDLFCHCGKRILTLYESQRENELNFFHNAAVLKHLYRFICDYELEIGSFAIQDAEKVAFFPGTFDPFSLSHKAIAREIRDMGCEVYLALDEFSWSKKTQPRLQRRRIMSMSVSDEESIYIFPDDFPVNIANPADLTKLKKLFAGKELYFVAGSDVIENASCYRMEPQQNSIHTMNHIIFKRSSDERRDASAEQTNYPISGKIINLHLEEYFEDISSTRIRENIDSGRDISNLIDPVAQNYIFENSLYMREPAYKHVLQARDMQLEPFTQADPAVLEGLQADLTAQGYDPAAVRAYLAEPNVSMLCMHETAGQKRITAIAAVKRVDSIDLLTTFGDQDIAAYIRSMAAGSIAVIGGLFFAAHSTITNREQIILVEMLSELLARDYTYVVYHPCHEAGLDDALLRTVTKQGFRKISPGSGRPIYAVDMRSPVIIFKNTDTLIKHPLNKRPAVLAALEQAHDRLLRILTEIYPSELVLSYSSEIMYHKMIHLIARLNHVAPVPYAVKSYGKYMAVPFGKVLEGTAVPNTVTKALHTEKYFYEDISGFTIEERSYYSTLENQIRTIRSFNRPVILVDDLLHKGYRMKEIDPILKANGVVVADTVVGVQTGRGRDLMTLKERSVDSAYFLPNLKCWIDESALYPYIGGDSMKAKGMPVAVCDLIPSLNLVLPFAIPSFLGNISNAHYYDFSMTALTNARDILKTLEEEYQKTFEQKLTLKRLGEVITSPKNPDLLRHTSMDENMAASDFVTMDIEKLIRMKKLFK